MLLLLLFSRRVVSNSVNPIDCCATGFPVIQYLLESAQTYVHWVADGLILCCPLLLLPSIFPSIRVFSNELALRIRWPEYQSLRFSISPSNEYSRLITFRIDWFDLLALQGTLKSLLQHHNFKSINSSMLSLFYTPTPISVHDYWKNHTGLCQQSNVSAF